MLTITLTCGALATGFQQIDRAKACWSQKVSTGVAVGISLHQRLCSKMKHYFGPLHANELCHAIAVAYVAFVM